MEEKKDIENLEVTQNDTPANESQEAVVVEFSGKEVEVKKEPVADEPEKSDDVSGNSGYPTEGKEEKPSGESGKKNPLKALASQSVLGNKTIEDVIKREAKEEQDVTSPFSLSRTLGGVIIARALQRQIGLVLLVCVFLIIYINNRYVCQKKLVEIDRMERQMVEARYKAIVCTSILTEKSRESNIMHMLKAYGDSTLTIPMDPPYLIQVEE